MFFDDGEDFLIGVVVGALIGAGAALLLAPESGKRTRRRIRRTAEDLSDVAGEKLQEAAEDARKAADDALKAAERSGTRLRDSVDKGRKKLKIRT